MTNLNKTPLTTSQKIECAAKVVAMQEHGEKTLLSQEYNLSRPTLYELEITFEQLLRQHFESGGGINICVDKAQLERAVVAMRVVAPNSYRDIEELLPIIYPKVSLSYGSIQKIAVEAGENSRPFLEQTDLSAVDAGALDEMFSQGDPVLAGVDLDSGYLFGLEHRKNRSQEDWADFLNKSFEQNMDLKIAIKDAAPGIAAGVAKIFPNAEQRDDCFHVIYELNKVRSRLERQAYAAIQADVDSNKKLVRVLQSSDEKKRAKQIAEYSKNKQYCQKIVDEFDCVDGAVKQVRHALECIDIEKGCLRSGEEVEKLMQQAAASIKTIARKDCQKVGTYVSNRASGLALATTDLMGRLEALNKIYTPMIVLLACLIWQALGKLETTKSGRQANFLKRYSASAWKLLQQEAGSMWEEAYETVTHELEHHHRASSAIEGFNSTLRPYLYVHKSVSQNFLNLFRAYYNLRKRKFGKHKGTSAHEVLTGKKIDDWLTKIGYPPSKTLH